MSEPDKTPLLREALVFLLHHRDGVHPRVLAAALWPLGATAAVAEATFARLATWLGEDPHGEPNLQTDDEGRLRLGPYVWSDWDMFQSLQERALHDAAPMSREQRDQLLKVAMDLVRGPFLADRETGRYGWLAYEVAEAQIPAIIADTALRLADSLTDAGLAENAIEAVKAGMRGSPDDEELWRGLLRATAATGDTERLRGAVEGLYKRTWYVHGVQGLHPRTEALVDELLPSWREVVVA
jgi:Bacterial transcriptional activator domain